MQFLPAVQPTGLATENAWALAFFEGKLLLPEGDTIELHPHDPALHPSVRARQPGGGSATLKAQQSVPSSRPM
jgi:hypothetical protein